MHVGNNLCGYGGPLPPGVMAMKMLNSVFKGFSGPGPSPNISILSVNECDNRDSQHSSTLSCTTTNMKSVTGETTITQGVSLGEEISVKFEWRVFLNLQ